MINSLTMTTAGREFRNSWTLPVHNSLGIEKAHYWDHPRSVLIRQMRVHTLQTPGSPRRSILPSEALSLAELSPRRGPLLGEVLHDEARGGN
jgi:hypothetical protein